MPSANASPAEATVLVMTKTPEAGKVKTRLAKTWGSAKALRGYLLLVEKTLSAAEQSGLPRQLHIAGSLDHPLWLEAKNRGWQLFQQQGSDLGERMHKASETLPCILIGCDFPALTGALLSDVSQRLQQHDAVAIPATDGGYVLLALNSNPAELFAEHRWGSSTVWATTCAAMQKLGLNVYEYPAERDLDTANDWQRSAADGHLPHSAAV